MKIIKTQTKKKIDLGESWDLVPQFDFESQAWDFQTNILSDKMKTIIFPIVAEFSRLAKDLGANDFRNLLDQGFYLETHEDLFNQLKVQYLLNLKPNLAQVSRRLRPGPKI